MSTQFTAGVREELAEEFGLPLERVRVIVDGMGGGFGSKSSLGVLRARRRRAVATGRARRCDLSSIGEEEQMDAGNRPETWQRLRIGARRDGTLTAISLQSYGSAGVAVGAGVGNFAEATLRLSQFRSPPNTTSSSTPGRDARCARPGNTPGAFAMEQAIDELAETLGARSAGAARPHRPQRGAARGTPDRRASASAGSGGARPAPIRARSSAASAWRNRCGAPTCRLIRPAKCGSIATARSRYCRACRTSEPASAR